MSRQWKPVSIIAARGIIHDVLREKGPMLSSALRNNYNGRATENIQVTPKELGGFIRSYCPKVSKGENGEYRLEGVA
jgi:hypothetical protein